MAACLQPGSARAYYFLGAALLSQKRLGLALEAAERAIRLAPDQIDCILLLARVQNEQGCQEEAEKSLCRALTIDPNAVDVLEDLSLLCRRTGRYDEALRLVGSALAIAPERRSLARLRSRLEDSIRKEEHGQGAQHEQAASVARAGVGLQLPSPSRKAIRSIAAKILWLFGYFLFFVLLHRIGC